MNYFSSIMIAPIRRHSILLPWLLDVNYQSKRCFIVINFQIYEIL